MLRGRNPQVLLLQVGLAVEFGIAAVLRGPGALRLLEGRPAGTDVVAAVGLVWLPVLALLSWAAAQRVQTLRRGLADRDGHLAALSATSHDWLWQATPDLRTTSCSPASLELLGYRPDELNGRCVLDLVHDDDVGHARRVLDSAVLGRTGWTDLELRWRHAAGYLVSLQGSASPVLDRKGRLVGFRGTWHTADGVAPEHRRMQIIAHRTREVIAARTIETAAQPIIDLATGTWVGVEALSRFPDNGNPDRWFAEAHEAGAGVALELYALESAIQLLAALPDSVYLSVNASPAVILDPGFERFMRRSDVSVERIVLEITEHTEISRYDDIRLALLPHRERGLRLAVDDAGAGYASFNHVLKLRPDIIKLDRSLVSTIDVDSARRALVTAIVMLALDTRAQVTAEGVETTSELEVLRRLGVDTVQGYLLARPSTDRSRLHTWQQRDWLTHAGVVRQISPVRPRTAGDSGLVEADGLPFHLA
jgi:PAS domain S-box-containing protein